MFSVAASCSRAGGGGECAERVRRPSARGGLGLAADQETRQHGPRLRGVCAARAEASVLVPSNGQQYRWSDLWGGRARAALCGARCGQPTEPGHLLGRRRATLAGGLFRTVPDGCPRGKRKTQQTGARGARRAAARDTVLCRPGGLWPGRRKTALGRL